MDFDFHQQFKDYSNIDLLKIVRLPANYQPAAVKAAEDILSERQISADEISVADQYIQDIENSEKNKKEKIDVLKHRVTDFLEPVINPSEKVEPDKWVNILLLVIGIQYAWTIFKTVKVLIDYFQCTYCTFDIAIVISLWSLIYIPVIFFLLLKRRRWGWILLFADNLFVLISSVSQSYIFFKYQHIHQGDTTSFLVQIFIRAAFVSFLWRNSITEHFGVSYETKKKTALIATTATLLFIFITFLLIE
jgi:hypothetical protein